MSNILVSACLLGINCKYNGKNNRNERVLKLMEKHTLIPVCPEQLGGMQTPREPPERLGEKVVNKSGYDVTENYKRGAEEALRIAKLYGCKQAVLKEKSPSCGTDKIYDGSFSGTIADRAGVTVQLLRENGIEVIGENSELL